MNYPNFSSGTRSLEVDALRGAAIILMVIFHFGYDLTVFGWADYNTGVDIEWRVFRAIIVTGFLLAVGISSYIAYHRAINYSKLLKAVAKLVAVAILLTLFSLFMYPDAWIYFGIIHFIALALPISVCFVAIPRVALAVGLTIIIGYWLNLLDLKTIWLWSTNNIGIPKKSVDLVVFFPWIGVVLIGVYLGHRNIFGLTLATNKGTQGLAFLGQHSLVIYIIHQPILYGILGGINWAIGF